MGTRRWWWGVGAGAALVLAACQQPAAVPPAAAPPAAPTGARQPEARATDDAELRKLVDGARQEGQLNVVWSSTYDAMPFADGFNRAYGLNVNVRYTPVPNFRSAAFQVSQEVQAGRSPSSDVVMVSPNLLLRMVEGDALEALDWSWAPNVTNPELVAPKGVGVVAFEQIYGITYNSSLLMGERVPRTMQDLLKPELKGRLASTPQAIGFSDLGSDQMWGEQRLFDYLGRFSDQLAGLIQCGEEARIASGEFVAFAIDCGHGSTLLAKAQGQPVDVVIPSDAAIFWAGYLGVPRGALHPNAAKLWINYMLSREAQDRFYQMSFTDTHLLPGSHNARLLDDLKAAGAKITAINLQWVQAQGESTTRQDKAADILRTANQR